MTDKEPKRNGGFACETAESPTFPPAATDIHSIIASARQRYARMPPYARPALDGPHDGGALLTSAECVALARLGHFPLSAEAIRRGTTPAETLRQQIADEIADALARILETFEV